MAEETSAAYCSLSSKCMNNGQSGRKRGPYKRWLMSNEPVLVETNAQECQDSSEPLQVIHSSKVLRSDDSSVKSNADDEHYGTTSFNIQEVAGVSVDMCDSYEPVMDNVDGSNVESSTSRSFYEYSPPINDHEDEMLDALLSDLQSKIQEETSSELAEDCDDPINVLFDDVLEAAEHETLQTEDKVSDSTDNDPPLYPGSRRQLGVTVLLMCCFMIRFRLSDETMQYLLVLLQLLLPDNNVMVRSLHGLKKYMGQFTFEPVIRYYCSHCYAHVAKDTKVCVNEHCLKDLTQAGSLSYFVLHSLTSQLQILFKRKSFTESIRSNRFHHFNTTPHGHLSDVYDGSLYQNLYHSGLLKNPNNISFAMSTDGVAIFKSSKISMWPVYMLVNELPLSQRKARENILFYGIWISSKKPIMWSFLQPMYEELKKLESGVKFVDHEDKEFLCQGALLTCTCDLPAKCLVSNSVQFNGYYPCWHCMQRGQTVRTEAGGNPLVLPFNMEDPSGPARTVDSVRTDVKQTVNNIKEGQRNYMVHGIKGPSWLMFLSSFDFVGGFVIDYMHGVCGGVTKLLLSLWFAAAHKKAKFSCYSSKEQVTKMLTKIKPTINITRVPRSLDDLAYWKASEYRNFLLYWGIPILKNIMERVYFLHFCLLVKAIFLLSSECISPNDLETAEQCLCEFVKQFEDLYSLRYMTMNVHQLLHLSQTVRHCGPLFSNNSFVFEDINGYIVSHIHGTQGVDTQIIQTINLIQAIPVLYEQCARSDKESLAFIDRMNGTIYHNSWEKIGDDVYRIDVPKSRCVQQNEFLAMKQKYVNVSSNLVKCWLRIFMKKNSSYVYATKYKKMLRRNQSVVKYKDGGVNKFGSVQFFSEVPCGISQVNVAVILPFHMNFYNKNDHIHLVQKEPDMDIIDIVLLHDIICPSLCVETNDQLFICEFPNRYERD